MKVPKIIDSLIVFWYKTFSQRMSFTYFTIITYVNKASNLTLLKSHSSVPEILYGVYTLPENRLFSWFSAPGKVNRGHEQYSGITQKLIRTTAKQYNLLLTTLLVAVNKTVPIITYSCSNSLLQGRPEPEVWRTKRLPLAGWEVRRRLSGPHSPPLPSPSQWKSFCSSHFRFEPSLEYPIVLGDSWRSPSVSRLKITIFWILA